MLKKYSLKITFIALASLLSFVFYKNFIIAEDTLGAKLSGRLLLQVESRGEAWYINPVTFERYFLGSPADAYATLRNLAVGINNSDLQKIPTGLIDSNSLDSDADGLADTLEEAIGTDKNKADSDSDGYSDKTEIVNGYNPLGADKISIDKPTIEKQKGKILIPAEKYEQTWYVNPLDGKKYFIADGNDAYSLIKKFGLGISNANLAKISASQQTAVLAQKLPVSTSSQPNYNKYADDINGYSFEYPAGWKIKKDRNILYLGDYAKDLFDENKGLVIVNFVKTDSEINDLNIFKIAAKNDAKNIADQTGLTGENKTVQYNFEYDKNYELNITIQKGPKELLLITMVAAKNNYSYYLDEYKKLLNSIEFK